MKTRLDKASFAADTDLYYINVDKFWSRAQTPKPGTLPDT